MPGCRGRSEVKQGEAGLWGVGGSSLDREQPDVGTFPRTDLAGPQRRTECSMETAVVPSLTCL